jgi:hypothetical protein
MVLEPTLYHENKLTVIRSLAVSSWVVCEFMYRLVAFVIPGIVMWLPSAAASAEQDGHQLPHHHIALVVGRAHERASDGHAEDGNLLGVEWVRQFSERWSYGIVFEQEAFGENRQANRHAILAIPVSYHMNDHWRIFGAAGMEFRKFGDPDKPLFRLGSGYGFDISSHFTIAPEVMIDFVSGGDKVYVVALAFGYGF